jgi:hypothetical protein
MDAASLPGLKSGIKLLNPSRLGIKMRKKEGVGKGLRWHGAFFKKLQRTNFFTYFNNDAL